MPIQKRKITPKKKLARKKAIIKTEISVLAAVALFLAAMPLAVIIGLWSALFAVVISKT